MSRTPISFKQLQALEAVARLGSFTRAAKFLGVSQPTISNLIHSIERRYRCRLFDRHGQSVAPTETLEGLRGSIKAMLALGESIERQLSDGRALQTGRLQIGYSTYQLAIPILSDFVRAHPGVAVNARALATHDLLPLLAAGDIDVGFLTAAELPAGLDGIEIAPARIGLVLPADHPLTAKETASWADLAGLKLIQRETSSGTRQIFEAAARLKNAPIATVLGLGSWGSIVSLVRSGVGVGVAFERECIEVQDLVFRPIDDPNLQARHYLACRPEMRAAAAVDGFFAIAQARCDDTVT